MSLLKKLAGETAIYGSSSILSRLLNYFILVPFFTRAFSPGEYGIVSDLYAWTALLMVIYTYRFETTFFRFGSQEGALQRTFSTASLSLLGTTVLFTGLLIALSPGIAQALSYPENPDYVVWFALILAFDTLSAIPFARLRLENRPIRFAILKTLSILINIAFIFFFLKLCPYLLDQGWAWVGKLYDPDRRVAYVFISNLLASGAILLLLSPVYFRIRLVFDGALWRRMFRYAAPLIIAGVAGIINQLVGIPLIKELASDDVDYNLQLVGLYGAAAKLAVLMNLFTQAFNYAAEPFFFKNAAQQEGSVEIYAQIARAFTLVGSFAFLGIMLYLDLIQFFLGREFRSALGVVPLLLLAYLFLGLFYNFSIWYKLADRTVIGGYIAVGGAAITLGLNFLLIPRIGYFGPAWAALACYFFMAAASYWTGQRQYPIPYPVPQLALYVGSAVAAYGLSVVVRPYLGGELGWILGVNSLILLGWVGSVLFRGLKSVGIY